VGDSLDTAARIGAPPRSACVSALPPGPGGQGMHLAFRTSDRRFLTHLTLDLRCRRSGARRVDREPGLEVGELGIEDLDGLAGLSEPSSRKSCSDHPNDIFGTHRAAHANSTRSMSTSSTYAGSLRSCRPRRPPGHPTWLSSPSFSTDRACSVGPLGRVTAAGYGSPGILLGAHQSAAEKYPRESRQNHGRRAISRGGSVIDHRTDAPVSDVPSFTTFQVGDAA